VQPDRIQITVRPRGGWEALDLGFRMAREWWKPLWGAWCAVLIPLTALLCYALWTAPYWTVAVLWWLKPALDRVPLHVLSEALFGHVPSVGETLRALPRVLRTSSLLASLTWLRFSPLRSLALPVLQLEGLSGPRRRERTRLLAGREFNAALGLLIACASFQFFTVFMGVLGMVVLLSPETSELSLEKLVQQVFAIDEVGLPHQLLGALYALCLLIVEPFYVAARFSLYINRRMYLEGWDIDLVFRKLARRTASARGAAAALGLLVGLALATPRPAVADPESAEPAPRASEVCRAQVPESARACIEQIKGELDTRKTVEVWRMRRLGSSEVEFSGLDWLGQLLSRTGRAVLWIAGAAGLVTLAVLLLRQLRGQPLLPRRARAAQLDPNAGLERSLLIDPASLPDDIVRSARNAFAAGDTVLALSLLYRGALVHLVERCGLEVPVSATEGDCTRLARRRLEPGLAGDFGALTLAWQFCAYGDQSPDAAAFAELCQRWAPRLEERA